MILLNKFCKVAVSRNDCDEQSDARQNHSIPLMAAGGTTPGVSASGQNWAARDGLTTFAAEFGFGRGSSGRGGPPKSIF